MQKLPFKTLMYSIVGSAIFGISNIAWAQQCVSPLPDLMPPEAEELLTDFDGNMTCENLGAALKCSISGGAGDCISNTGPKGEQFTVTSSNNGGEIQWSVTSTVIGGIDNVITDSAQGANGCLYGFRFDATDGRAGFLKSNDSFARVNQVEFCADLNVEPVLAPPPPAPVVQTCELDAGQSIFLAGVEIKCPFGTPGFNKRTIVVATDTDASGVAVPDKGFQNAEGEIAFDQFLCVCNGLGDTEGELQCNPNLAFGDLPDATGEFAGLSACIVEQNTDSTESVDFTNPTCVTSGGRRRCY